MLFEYIPSKQGSLPPHTHAPAAAEPPTPTSKHLRHTEQVRLWKTHVALYNWRVLLEALRPDNTQTPKTSNRGIKAYMKLIEKMQGEIGPMETCHDKTSEQLRLALCSVEGDTRVLKC